METQTLGNHPQIIDLYAVLEQNGLLKQKEQIQSLVDYIENADDKLTQMMGEIKDLRGEVGKLHDKTIQAKCVQLVALVEGKIQQARTMVSVAKDNLIFSAGAMLTAFKEKGRSALRRAVEAMHIPSALSHMEKGFSHAAKSVRQSAGKLDSIRGELHEMGAHAKNAGRALLGKSPQQAPALDADQGVLAKLRGCFEAFGNAFTAMEKRAGRMAERASGKPSGEQKSSVKSELREMKSEHADLRHTLAGKEQAR